MNRASEGEGIGAKMDEVESAYLCALAATREAPCSSIKTTRLSMSASAVVSPSATTCCPFCMLYPSRRDTKGKEVAPSVVLIS